MSNIEMVSGHLLVKQSNPFTMIITGQTGSGKTQFVLRMLEQNEVMFVHPFSRIVFCYSILQGDIVALANKKHEIELFEGFPENLNFDGRQTLLILDDMMLELRNDVRLAALFTKMRHKNVSTIFITQNLYFNSKYATTITRNAQYLVLFQNPRDNSMIDTLGRQVYPQKRKFLSSAFAMATDIPYGYLFLDFKPDTPKNLRVRQGVFPGEQSWVYVPSP